MKNKTIHKHKNKKMTSLKLVAVGFVVMFACVGAYLLVVSRAAVTLKAQHGGVIDRQGQPDQSAYYPSPINGFVVKNYDNTRTDTSWAALQPTQNGPIAANNSIDRAIANVRGTNVRLKLRIYAGSDAPEWAKNLPVTTGKQGPFQICSTRPTTADCGMVGHFWEVNHRQAYKDFMAKMAAKYDNVPEIEEVVISSCTTTFAEPMLRQGNEAANIAAYVTAGYSEKMNRACHSDALEAHKAWTTTRSSIALNPSQEFIAASGSNPAKFVTNEDYTEQYIDECRAVLGQRCVLGNNSIGKKDTIYPCSDIDRGDWASRDNYARMYTKIKCAGAPIYFQTSAPKGIVAAGSNLNEILTWAAQVGAGMVELPAGYDNPSGESASAIYLTPAQLAAHDQALQANASPASGVSDPPPPSDTTPPVTSITTPSSGSTIAGTTTLSATATDNVAVSRVEFYQGTSLLGSDASSPYSYAWNTTAVANGTYSLTARAYDAANNVATSSAVTVTVNNATAPPPDTTPPTTSITAPASGATVSATTNVSATATDNVAVSKVELYIDGTLSATDVASPYVFSWNTTAYTNASHALTTKAYDAAGNVRTSTVVSVTVNNSQPPGPKPGDVNGDTKVDVFDASILLFNFGKSGKTRAQGDLNGDGVVNVFDASILLFNFGK